MHNKRCLTKNKEKHLSNNIIQHLLQKKDHKDDLEGISLFVYDKELKNLSGEIISTIGDLVSKGLLKELKNSSGQKCYQLSDIYSFK